MKQELFTFCEKNEVTPAVFSVINLLLQTTNGLHTYFLSEFQDAIDEAVKGGFIEERGGRLWLTQKAKAFVHEFLVLSRDDRKLH